MSAYVGTTHSFADRLLRLRPVEALLSPPYEIAEDDEALVRETFEALFHAVENGTLALELEGAEAAARADEVTETVLRRARGRLAGGVPRDRVEDLLRSRLARRQTVRSGLREGVSAAA